MPDTELMPRRLLGGLFEPIVARLAEGLQVRFIPEQALVASVWDDMVTHQFAGVAFYATAAGPLALEQITVKDGKA